ncbi:MAG: hypothetical protein GX751_03890 [Desulfuromonadaceae bacterium]|nr:hypothetical protein [Desulfuromonadaceae bacterium]
MSTDRDVMEVALEAGKQILVRANGDPARTLAYGVAAAVTAVGVGIGFGTCKYGRKLIEWIED